MTRLRTISAIVAAALALSGCATTGATRITDATLNQSIEQASTTADHVVIATYYEVRAHQAENDLRERQAARRHYAHEPAGMYYPNGSARTVLEHYDRLMAGYEQTALENHALASWHRQLADEASHGRGGP